MGTKKIKRIRFFRFTWLEILAAFLGVVIIWYLFLTLLPSYNPSVSRRVHSTKRAVLIVRSQILKFKEINGRYPNSLAELQQYSKENPNLGFREVFIIERISDPNGNSKEYDVLNGEGGWYYDKNTGEVKLNLTKPVKRYLKSYYVGKIGNEVPSNW